jgi:hypothetical protein
VVRALFAPRSDDRELGDLSHDGPRSDRPAPLSGGPDRGRAGHTAAAIGILGLLSYAYRLPALLNAGSTNSDAAVVGLQAMHILKGEHSPFLWGSGYQTSADAFVAAAFFLAGGPTPLMLMLSALTLHVIATILVFATLHRRFTAWSALLLTMPVVFSPASVHTYALYPPRQLSITLAIASIWSIHGASSKSGGRATALIALGGAFYGLAVSADPYPLVLAPIVLGYALLCSSGRLMRRLPPFGTGLLAGLVPFALLHRMSGAQHGQLGLTTSVLRHNWDLLVRECLPWALSYKVYAAKNAMDYAPWDAPIPVEAVQLTGAIIVGAIVLYGLFAIRSKVIPSSIRHLGFAGAMAYPVTIGAFLVSVMVMDHFSMRYLAVLTLMLPFAAAPIAHALGGPRFAVLVAPHLVASSLCGWLGYGPFVRGPMPVLDSPDLRDDYALFDHLRARGITYAQADYWASYRLTFLFSERLVVVPTNPSEDRYPPYRQAFEAAPVFAYVFDPNRSRENVKEVERKLTEEHAAVDEAQVGGRTVFVITRRTTTGEDAPRAPE